MIKYDKEYLLTKSKTFCMSPWIHIYVAPSGKAGPCCIHRTIHTPMADASTQCMSEMVNSEQMNQLRLDMVNEVMNPICGTCHEHEATGVITHRQSLNGAYAPLYDEVMESMDDTGALSSFKMRYFDIRFSNICNMKCRTCGPEFSSIWEQEVRKHSDVITILPKNNRKAELLQEVVEQVPYIQTAYFAGGEPLITEEHYVLLEEMIRQKRTDIKLQYNTNLSTLKFKDKDLLSLWKQFTGGVFVYASIDHYGDRAEYIRHGTNWAQIERNFRSVKETPFIHLQMNTVLSVYNYTTFGEFYQYLIDKELYTMSDMTYSIYNMNSPVHLGAGILPQQQRQLGSDGIRRIIDQFNSSTVPQARPRIGQLQQSINWIESAPSTWEQHKDKFRAETIRIDNIRGESFAKTFPELAGLMTDE